jgi:hypothetical protein
MIPSANQQNECFQRTLLIGRFTHIRMTPAVGATLVIDRKVVLTGQIAMYDCDPRHRNFIRLHGG